jgi:rhodanese-related sulfurtransferase
MEITVSKAKEMSQEDSAKLLDVRTRKELDICKIEGAMWIPLDELQARFGELPKKKIIVFCCSGGRSAIAARFLKTKGYDAVSMAGGIRRWAQEIDTSLKLY